MDKAVGTLVFDPEGEYFWPDEHARPGLCNVPHLREKIAVFTNRPQPNPYYGSWKVGDLKLDLAKLPPGDVVSLCISEKKHDDQNVTKIRTIDFSRWPDLINLLFVKEWNSTDADIQEATGIATLDLVQCSAMRNNLVPIIKTLHDPQSNLITLATSLLRRGIIVVVDLSLVSGKVGLQIAGMLMNHIFRNNQESFTDPQRGSLIPTIVILEEAQSVLGKASKDDSPFVQWVKEGRKYSLGAILVTQQPGSIMPELLSQGDTFFAFHLLSAHDLKTLQFHNAHFSDDVLAHLLNEPIRGNAYFWSAPHQPFVLPARIRNYEGEYRQFMPTLNHLDKHLDTGLDEIRGAKERLIAKLADSVKQVIISRAKPYEVEGQTGVFAVFKPRMSAIIAEKLDGNEKDEYCSGANKSFVNDNFLAAVLLATGLFGSTLCNFIGIRKSDNKKGEFIEGSISALPEGVQLQDSIIRE